MSTHLHKRFEEHRVLEVFDRYLSGEIGAEQGQTLLGIGRSRFFELVRLYRRGPEQFSLEYKRKTSNHRICEEAEEKILRELETEAKLIKDKGNPIEDYNYSYIKDTLERKYKVKVSLPTIIRRAKKKGFIKKGGPRRFMTERC